MPMMASYKSENHFQYLYLQFIIFIYVQAGVSYKFMALAWSAK